MTEQINSIADGNNSEVETYKSKIKELEEKLGKTSTEIDEHVRFQKEVAPALQLIGNNPELRDKFRETWGKVYGDGVVSDGKEPGVESKESNAKKASTDLSDQRFKEVDGKVSKIERTTREKAIKDFEVSHGISDLADDKKKEVRRSIEEYLNTFGQSVQTAPLETLETVLEKAHVATGAEKAIKEGTFENYAKSYTNYSGALPHMGGRQLEPEQTGTLDAKQKSWAEKLGVDPKKAEEAYKNQDKEKTRLTKAESEKK